MQHWFSNELIELLIKLPSVGRVLAEFLGMRLIARNSFSFQYSFICMTVNAWRLILSTVWSSLVSHFVIDVFVMPSIPHFALWTKI